MGEIFVANYIISAAPYPSGTVSVICDGSSQCGGSANTVLTTITVGTYPEGVVYDSGMGEIFVANSGGFDSATAHPASTVSVICDGSSQCGGSANTVVTTIKDSHLNRPTGIAYDSGMGEIFVTNIFGQSVSMISDRTNTVLTTIPLSGANGVAYDPVKGEIFATAYDPVKGGVIAVIPDH
jgi:DNA-binding beta-propeller fold protein YncE